VSRRASLLAAAALAAVAVAGCGGDDPGAGAAPGGVGATSATGPGTAAARATTTDGSGGTGGPAAPASGATGSDAPGADVSEPPGDAAVPAPPASWTATCPTRTTSPLGCRGVRGRVLAIQAYDPDGDGDLHVIAVGGDVTTPGITVFDVRPSLRPDRDPVKGEYVTGAGPVFRGSLGQRQIQVDVFRVWRPRG
jgi:hypothetical protein